jgi:uridine kinase
MLDKLIISHVPDLFNRLKLPLSIGIVGESASGKSTITEDFISVLNNHNISTTRINTDDYYFDNSEAVKEAGSFAAWA